MKQGGDNPISLADGAKAFAITAPPLTINAVATHETPRDVALNPEAEAITAHDRSHIAVISRVLVVGPFGPG